MHIINKNILLNRGRNNSVLYKADGCKLLHIKNKLADMIIDGQELPERVLEFVGSERRVQTIDDYLADNPVEIGVDSIYVDLTNACNLTCKGCYSYQKQKSKNISTEYLDIISSIDVKEGTNLVLLGGEPLLFPIKKIYPYIKCWADKFNEITIFTNSIYFDERWASIFNEFSISVRFTLYSLDRSKHDNYVGLIGGYDSVFDAINLAKDKQLDYKVNVILNEEEYLAFNDGLLGEDVQKERFSIDLIRPNANYEMTKYSGVKIMKNGLTRPLKNKSFKRAIRDTIYHSCYTGKLSISVDGEVSHCPWKKIDFTGNFKNLDDNKVIEAWRKPISDSYTYCKECEFNFLCFDCTDLNSTAGVTIKRPITCSYNPLIGEMSC
ncbi:radical SAM protein [Vibrio vulnificus]|nr:radical SAM protein [Vibrio vulnificus]EJE8577504.1 radical SAM protein [Vibrio vulnificus]